MMAILLLASTLLAGDPQDTAAKTSEGRLTRQQVEAQIQSHLDKLPGHTGMLWTELTDEGPVVQYGRNEQDRFAVGSTFKLFILGALADEVNASRRRLDDTMLLDARWFGPPASELSTWPLGSPITLNTLALKMISISDNTATDHLLHLLGRRRVERQLAVMGHQSPEWNRPLLFTREMAMIRDKAAAGREEQYAKLDEAGRRKFLAELTGTPDYENLDFDTRAFNVAEWFARPTDMARALDWLRRHTEKDQPAALLRDVMAVETKLEYDREQWPHVGFKGGSEDRLIAGNWLLRHRNGRWYTFHLYWNSPDEDVTVEAMGQALQAIFSLIEKQLAANETQN